MAFVLSMIGKTVHSDERMYRGVIELCEGKSRKDFDECAKSDVEIHTVVEAFAVEQVEKDYAVAIYASEFVSERATSCLA